MGVAVQGFHHAVSVVVPFHNAAGTVSETVRVLRAFDPPVLEMVLVDDGSTDGGAERALEAACGDDRIRLVRIPHGGEAAALNAGLAEALRGGGPGPAFVAIVEADVAPEGGWLAALLRAFDDAGVGCAGGILKGDPRDPWIARLAGHEVEGRFPASACDVAHVTSAAAIYRREAFGRATGGWFREDLVNAGLDSDFNARLRRAGWRVRFVPEARARHRYKPSLAGYLARQFAYGRYRSGEPFLYPRDRVAALELAATWGLLGGGAAALLLREPAAALACWVLLPLLFLPWSVRAWRRTRDRAVFGAPFVFPLRYIAFGLGLATNRQWGSRPAPGSCAPRAACRPGRAGSRGAARGAGSGS